MANNKKSEICSPLYPDKAIATTNESEHNNHPHAHSQLGTKDLRGIDKNKRVRYYTGIHSKYNNKKLFVRITTFLQAKVPALYISADESTLCQQSI